MPVVTICGRKVFVVPELKTPHKFIYIHGNSAFTKENGVVLGSGTKTDPYIIENWDIDASTADGIRIENTDAYFVIRNCIVYNGGVDGGTKSGIELRNVKNGIIERVDSYKHFYSIYLIHTEDIIIMGCNVFDNYHSGIVISGASHNQIINCNIYNNEDCGIWLEKTTKNIIKDCKGHNNKKGNRSDEISVDNIITNSPELQPVIMKY